MTNLFYNTAYAVDNPVDINSAVGTTFFKYTCIAQLIERGIDFAIIISGVILLVMLIWGGMEWLTSGGDKGKVENARNRITHSLIGITLVASGWAIWVIIITFLGIGGDICHPSSLSNGPIQSITVPTIP